MKSDCTRCRQFYIEQNINEPAELPEHFQKIAEAPDGRIIMAGIGHSVKPDNPIVSESLKV
ncbi:MAG: hypothetical protein RBS73_13695 [Prolixibacteraceae bacterium]|jgi:hypothetical protein|nr:hypothetical protein [Prolixibacteraceae bacterium]